MLSIGTPVEETFTPFRADILAAADKAYDSVSVVGSDRDEACKIPVCFDVSDMIVKSLVEIGYVAYQASVVSDEVGQHYYPVIMHEDEEIIAESSWQQFLPKDGRVEQEDLPKVLIGTRREIMRMARSYGVGESILRVWEARNSGPSFEQQRLNDQAAEEEAERAAEQGAWEKFTAA